MSKIFSKIIFSIVLFVSTFFIIFTSLFYNGYCGSLVLGNTLLNSLGLATEYYLGRAGRNIKNSNQISTNISGVSGITDGTLSTDYISAYADSLNISTPIDIDYIIRASKTVDVTNLSAEDLATFTATLVNDPHANNGEFVFKAFTLGGVTLYYALNKAGEWVGNSYNNIISSYKPISSASLSNIHSSLNSNYSNSHTSVASKAFSLPMTYYNNTQYGSVSINSPDTIFFYTVQNVLYCCISASTYISDGPADYSYKFQGHVNFYNQQGVQTINENFILIGGSRGRAYTTTIDGLTYYYGPLNSDLSIYGYWGTNTNFGSLQEITSMISNDTIDSPYNTELIDSQSLPYTVPDIDGYGGTIADIYPALDLLRQAILTIPSVDDLASALSDALEGSIEDVIDYIKSLTITVPDVLTEEDDPDDPWPSPPDNVPDWIVGIIPDLLPDEMFGIFQPVFDIVGSANSMNSTFVIIPAILVVAFIVYFIVSVL